MDLQSILVEEIERLQERYGDEIKFVLIAADKHEFISYCASFNAAGEAVTMCSEVALMYEGHKKGGRMS
jgi:hypothetical protein